MKVLFVSSDFRKWNNGGCIVTKRNFDFICKISNVEILWFCVPYPTKTQILLNMLLNRNFGSNKSLDDLFIKNLSEVDIVWFDSSLYGKWVEITNYYKKISIVFYHNIEAIYFASKFKIDRNIQNFLMKIYSKKLEKTSTDNSSFRVLLNDRDGAQLKSIYNSNADLYLSTSFDELDKSEIDNFRDETIEPYLFFVGSNFFANVQGITWFMNNVAPFVKQKIIIGGSICEAFTNYNAPSNVSFVGLIDDLTEYYSNASAIISPIFSGSGMKTKTIEALKYGKYIIGTKEAFVGIDSNEINNIGKLCETADDFIFAINKMPNKITFHDSSYRLFSNTYSSVAIFNKFISFWNTHIVLSDTHNS